MKRLVSLLLCALMLSGTILPVAAAQREPDAEITLPPPPPTEVMENENEDVTDDYGDNHSESHTGGYSEGYSVSYLINTTNIEYNDSITIDSFNDVRANAWYAEAVIRSVACGFVNGTGRDKQGRIIFTPNRAVKKSEAIKMAACIYESITKEAIPEAKDGEAWYANGEAWYARYVRYAMEKGIIEGTFSTDNTNYNAAITRGEFAKIAARLITMFPQFVGKSSGDKVYQYRISDIDKMDDPSILYLLYDCGIIDGISTSGDMHVSKFGVNGSLTRAQAATIFTRIFFEEARKNTSKFRRKSAEMVDPPFTFYAGSDDYTPGAHGHSESEGRIGGSSSSTDNSDLFEFMKDGYWTNLKYSTDDGKNYDMSVSVKYFKLFLTAASSAEAPAFQIALKEKHSKSFDVKCTPDGNMAIWTVTWNETWVSPINADVTYSCSGKATITDLGKVQYSQLPAGITTKEIYEHYGIGAIYLGDRLGNEAGFDMKGSAYRNSRGLVAELSSKWSGTRYLYGLRSTVECEVTLTKTQKTAYTSRKSNIADYDQIADGAKDAVVQACIDGIIKGVSVDKNGVITFNPKGNIKLCEAITMAVRLHALLNDMTEPQKGSGSQWYKPYLQYAIDNKLLPLDELRKDANMQKFVTRAQFATIIAKAAGLSTKKYYNISDVDGDTRSTYGPYIRAMYAYGIMNGTGHNDEGSIFSPSNNIKREDAARMFCRVLHKEYRKNNSEWQK